ncbi:DUF6883 domain-containing protein [Heyndrickxia sp. NPDC080065]|uniref:DUF6883 domain-containing protein n=1 Tax=Heyndrickxia sp. NPDC080065 TaxID=3390568 RepID=UPI003CFBEE75
MKSVTFFYVDDKSASHKTLAILLHSLLKYSINSCSIKIFHGLVLFEELGRKVSHVKQDDNCFISFSKSNDVKAHIKAYEFFCKEVENSPNSIKNMFSIEDFETGVYAITVRSIMSDTLIKVDKDLAKKDKLYKGYSVLDYNLLPNYLLFIEYMEDNCMLQYDKAIISDDIFQCDILEYLSDEQCQFVELDVYQSMVIDKKENLLIDEEGIEKTIETKQQANVFNFWHLLTKNAFTSLLNGNKGPNNFEIKTKERLSNKDVSDMSGKLLEYCLNPNHVVGKHKAKLFEEVLGFNQDNFYLLEARIKEGLKNCKLEFKKGLNKYGLNFSAYIEVQGISGNSKTIETAWEFNPNKLEKIRLVTAFIASKGEQSHDNATRIFFLENTTQDYYKTLLQKAKEYAEQNNKDYEVTPMILSSNLGKNEIVHQGEFGYSRILIKHKEFASWLVDNNEAIYYEEECIITIDKQLNYQLSRNYAENMIEIFELNRITAEVVSIYD